MSPLGQNPFGTSGSTMSLFYFSFTLPSTRPCKQKPHACLDEFRASVRFNLHFYVQHVNSKNGHEMSPAYAGKSAHINCYLRCTGDHPRLRGEKDSLSADL